MSANPREVPAGEFKAKCLALLDDVATTGQPIVITKRGRPVARLVPLEGQAPASLLGSVVQEGDLVGPIDEAWEAPG